MNNRTVYDLFSVEGKRALVTGGSVGIGRAVAEAFLVGNPQREPLILARNPADRWGVPDDLRGKRVWTFKQ